MILAPRFLNSFSRPAMVPSSVVQTGVKSLGCENRTAQPSPIQSWKLIVPWVVSAVKLGASSLMRSDMFSFLFLLQIFFPELCPTNDYTVYNCPDRSLMPPGSSSIQQKTRPARWLWVG